MHRQAGIKVFLHHTNLSVGWVLTTYSCRSWSQQKKAKGADSAFLTTGGSNSEQDNIIDILSEIIKKDVYVDQPLDEIRQNVPLWLFASKPVEEKHTGACKPNWLKRKLIFPNRM